MLFAVGVCSETIVGTRLGFGNLIFEFEGAINNLMDKSYRWSGGGWKAELRSPAKAVTAVIESAQR